MSRHLAFWKYDEGVYLDNQKVYEEACCEEKYTEGLSVLPISDIIDKVNDVFTDYEKIEECNYESEKGGFTVLTTKQTVLFECGRSMEEDELNKIIDIMLGFDCKLYDPQVSVRFDGH